jgi:hypothetical protein
MSEKTVKLLRNQIKKTKRQIFEAFTVEVSAMPFFERQWFCFRMSFKALPLQKQLKSRIKEHKRLVKAEKEKMKKEGRR